MHLSIVATLYRSSPFLAEFHRRMTESIRSIGISDYEIVFVNDGSPDDSLERAIDLQKQDAHVVIVDLSRNFGHHKAMMTGLMHARGELVFLIDTDLEEPPELLSEFWADWNKGGADMVFGQQTARRGEWFERMSGALFYKLLNLLCQQKFPENVLTSRLMSRRYVDALVQHRDQEVFILGLWSITGFNQRALELKKESHGHSTYTFGKKMALLVNAVTSFSNKPLVYIAYLGAMISGMAFLAAIGLIFRRIVFGDLLLGWPSTIVSIWLLGGITILCLGVIAIYLSKIFIETKDRPYTIVRAIYGRSDAGAS